QPRLMRRETEAAGWRAGLLQAAAGWARLAATRIAHVGNRLRAALVLLGALMALIIPLTPAQAFDDVDGDGLDAGLEDALASQFFPWVWFDSGENYGCTEPATPWNLGTTVARVRPHPADPTKITISYAILYRRDCGDWYGGSHNGDVEPFSMTLAAND